MISFDFCSPTRFIFGRGVEKQAGATAAQFGAKKVLIQYGGGSVKKSGLLDTVTASLREAGIAYVELGGVQPNPRVSLVREAIELCRKEGVDLILAVGGGSVIDSCKATGLGYYYDGDVWDFYCGKATPAKTLPVGVVLTLAAAGSEGSNSSVITNEAIHMKRGLNCELTRPAFALMNPELTFSLPAYQTACGAVDIMAHAMERYFTNTPHVELIDRMIEALIKTVMHNAPVLMENPSDYEARAEIMWAGTLAHNNLLGTGRECDWASHQLEHELSGIYDVAHGAGLAVVIPAWMKYVYKHDIARFAQFAVRVMDVEMDFFDPEKTAREGIRRLEAFYTSIGMPITLKELGVPTDRLKEMADNCKETDPSDHSTGHFIRLTHADCYEVYKLMA